MHCDSAQNEEKCTKVVQFNDFLRKTFVVLHKSAKFALRNETKLTC